MALVSVSLFLPSPQPRSNDCILGGVAQVGNWSLEPDEATAQGILERCARTSAAVQNRYSLR